MSNIKVFYKTSESLHLHLNTYEIIFLHIVKIYILSQLHNTMYIEKVNTNMYMLFYILMLIIC